MTAVAQGTIRARCSWNAYALGLLTFDSSTFDGIDTFAASPFSTGRGFVGPYDDMSALFRGAQIDRGTDDAQTHVLRGTCNGTFADPNSTFNVANPASPLAGLLDDRLHPFSLTNVYGGVEYPLFYGWARTVPATPGNRKASVQLQCVDLFYWLDLATPTIADTGPTTTGAAIAKILDAVGWTDPLFRSLDVGDLIPGFSADGTVTATQLIENLLEAELGMFFPAASGVATYLSRTSRYTRGSVATIADVMSNQQPTVDFDSVVNRTKVTRSQTGHVATAADQTSANKIGWHDDPNAGIETSYLISDAQADSLATWIVFAGKTARPPMRDLQIDNRTDALLQQILQRDLGHRITVQSAQGGVNGDYVIQGLHHDIGGDITTTYNLSSVPPFNVTQFDVSVFDSADIVPL